MELKLNETEISRIQQILLRLHNVQGIVLRIGSFITLIMFTSLNTTLQFRLPVSHILEACVLMIMIQRVIRTGFLDPMYQC